MVSVDKDKCIGCGSCAATCDEVFEMNSEGKAVVKSGANQSADCVKEAIEVCPVDAIS
jgi:ferredoxin